MFNKKQKKSRGFTLIELLVVIAIIGVLAGIVIVRLGEVRESTRNARIQAAVQQMRSVLELVADSNNPFSYVGLGGAASMCDAANSLNETQTTYGPQLGTVEIDIITQSGVALPANVCRANADTYCVEVNLAGTSEVWCVDSTGISRQQAAGTCTALNLDCT